jgi:hypothetical protein
MATTARPGTKTITMAPAAEESVPEPVTQRKQTSRRFRAFAAVAFSAMRYGRFAIRSKATLARRDRASAAAMFGHGPRWTRTPK